MATDYSELKGKKVNLTTSEGTFEGTVEAGSPIGIVFRAKGKQGGELVEAKDILNIAEAVAGPKKLRQRTLPRVAEGKFREHLVDRHGYQISQIAELSEEEAEQFHSTLDHTDLGHKHKELSPVEEAIAAASDDDED